MPMRYILFLFAVLSGGDVLAAGPLVEADYRTRYAPDPKPPEDIVRYRFPMDRPEDLLQLRHRPLPETFALLQEILNEGWREAAPLRPFAKQILYEHPDLERYLVDRMEKLGEWSKRKYQDKEFAREVRFDTEALLSRYISVAKQIPGDDAVRLVGSQLFAIHAKKINVNPPESTPAEMAHQALAWLVFERHGERIPRDLEAAREWWKKNEHRFATAAAPEPPAKSNPEQSTDVPISKDARSPVQANTSRQELPERISTSNWWPWAAAGGLLIFALAVFLGRPKKTG
jgi:hypothetical protein